MRRLILGAILLLAGCQSQEARDYPGPWRRMTPAGLAALAGTALVGTGSCVERPHATIPNRFLLACSYDHFRWTGIVVETGRDREVGPRYQHDVIEALGIPPRELLPERSRSQMQMDAQMNDMNSQRADEAERSGR
jgi:hypothetical protein